MIYGQSKASLWKIICEDDCDQYPNDYDKDVYEYRKQCAIAVIYNLRELQLVGRKENKNV